MPATGSTLVHTNHIVDARLRSLEQGDLLNSIMRLKRVERLLARGDGALSVGSIFGILSDHGNYPKSVRKHTDELHNRRVRTVASRARPGNPCEAPATTVRLSR